MNFKYLCLFLFFVVQIACTRGTRSSAASAIPLDTIVYTSETAATSNDYVHAEWHVCATGTYRVYVNMPEASPADSLDGFVVYAFADLFPYPNACSYNSGWTNHPIAGSSTIDEGFDVTVHNGDIVYFSFRCPEVTTKNALFSISIEPINAAMTPKPKAFGFVSGKVGSMSCTDSRTQNTATYPAFQGVSDGLVNYSMTVSYELVICPAQLPPQNQIMLSSFVVGSPGADAFQSFLQDVNGTLLAHDSDKRFVSYINYPLDRRTMPKSMILSIAGWGKQHSKFDVITSKNVSCKIDVLL